MTHDGPYEEIRIDFDDEEWEDEEPPTKPASIPQIEHERTMRMMQGFNKCSLQSKLLLLELVEKLR